MFYDILYTRLGSEIVYHSRMFADNRSQAISFLRDRDTWTDCIISITPTPNDLL